MAASAKELEKKLTEAGKKLLDPPSSVEDLLPLLDQVERCLSEVEQSPPDSMQNALSPLMKALVADKLFKQEDIDVNVAVAACISEITRITAPDAPYEDDQMKEVFQLIVSSFENLTDKSSRSYTKRTSILDTVAKVRSCVVMLDLECDGLIIEMFQHFLKVIREHHEENVFSSMETIMTLVLEESEDISPELLSPILDYVRKDDEVPQISRKLAEQVLKNSATKLKPYLPDVIKSLGLSLDKYNSVVASICEGTSGALKENETVANEKDDNEDSLAREVKDEDEPKAEKVASPDQAQEPKDGSLKSEVSNGVAQLAEHDSSVDTESTKKQDDRSVKDEAQKTDKLSDTEMDNAGDEETDVGDKQEQRSKKKGKQSSSVKQVESLKASDGEEETESRAPLDSKDGGKSEPSSPPHDSSANAAISSDEKETSDQALPSKPLADETANITSPSQSENLPDESRSKKAVSQKKKDNSAKEAKSSSDSAAKVAPEEPSSSEAKPTKKSGKKVASSSKTKRMVPTKKSTSESKPTKQSGKKAVDSDTMQESSKPKEDKKKQGRGKAIDEESSHTSSGDNGKPTPKSSKDEEHPSEETPKTDAKRKRNMGKEKASDDKEIGENLVGARVKVWWPKDRAFYKGVVDSYDAAKKKHLVIYDDSDQEILNLKREKWELIKDESESTEDEKADQIGCDETSATPQKKKAKTGNDQSAKQAKAETSAKKGGGSASSKSKAAAPATKSGKKSGDEKTENKSKDTSNSKTTRSGKKSEDERSESKTKEASKETSKEAEDDSSDEMSEDEVKPKTGSKAAASKPVSSKTKKGETSGTLKSGKTKEEAETGTSKASSKKKEEPSKSSSKSTKPSSAVKGKTGKGIGKSNGNGSGKTKPASTPTAKGRESDGESGSEDTPKAAAAAAASTKGKTPGTAKSQGKSGKKRKR